MAGTLRCADTDSAGGQWGPQPESGWCHQTAVCPHCYMLVASSTLSTYLCVAGGYARSLNEGLTDTVVVQNGVYLLGVFLETKQACSFKENN